MAIAAPGTELDESTPRPFPQDDHLPPDEDTDDKLDAGGDQILLAVDEQQERILVYGFATLTSPIHYRIMCVLVELFRQDTSEQLAPKNFRTAKAAELADKTSSPDEEATRQAISRLRKKLSKEHQELYGSSLSQDAVIESVQGKGYRINPAVRIVSPDQIRS
jgi:hypothetical protein